MCVIQCAEMPFNRFRPSNSNSSYVGESRKYPFNFLRHSTRVHPFDREKVRRLFPNMNNLPSFDCIGLKDFDLSFILDYENKVLSVQARQNGFSEPELGVLQIFHESKQTGSLRKIAKFIDMLMEKYGLIFLNAVVDNVIGSVERPKFSTSLPSQNKIVVFIDDPPIWSKRISWMGRMLSIGLLSHGIIPLLIPWNDLNNASHDAILQELSLLSPEATKDFRWILEKGFSLALRCAHKNVIILDVDWKLVKIHEFIAEAEAFGYELLFMKNHAEINRANFVRTVIERIKRLMSEKLLMEIKDPCTSAKIVVEEIRHQDYSEKIRFKKLNAPDKFNLSKAKPMKSSGIELRPSEAHGDVFDGYKITDSVNERNQYAEITGTFEPPLNSKCKYPTPGFLSRIFSNTQVKAKPTFLFDGLKPRNKKFIFTLPKLFSSAEIPSVDEPDQCQQQIYNPNILPRLTDDQFDRRLVRPKIYARETKNQEDKLFSHTRRDLEDLDSIFTNSVKSDSALYSK